MTRTDEQGVLSAMMEGEAYGGDDVLDRVGCVDELSRYECMESLGALVTSGRVLRTYAGGFFTYRRAPQETIDAITAREQEPPKAADWDRRTYDGYGNDLASHRALAMLARGR
ncbi:hypothetical protein [Paraburkholderia phosphatilytica]|uniref:hypothetical protein n=1 Tax=Paraburkholderia phosphatilytica TaxID=2282883 RepID=UPI000E53428F|nr:hypothetical protein [Paraburkholderia phosphatilytica]